MDPFLEFSTSGPYDGSTASSSDLNLDNFWLDSELRDLVSVETNSNSLTNPTEVVSLSNPSLEDGFLTSVPNFGTTVSMLSPTGNMSMPMQAPSHAIQVPLQTQQPVSCPKPTIASGNSNSVNSVIGNYASHGSRSVTMNGPMNMDGIQMDKKRKQFNEVVASVCASCGGSHNGPCSLQQISIPTKPGFGHPILNSWTAPTSLDVNYIKSKLMDLICAEKEIDKFCSKATTLLCQHMGVDVGGFYMNEKQNLKDWMMYCAYPSLPIFSAYFNFTTGFHLLMQAAVDKKCFSVNNTVASTNLTFFLVPIAAENGSTLGVIVLGCSAKTNTEIDPFITFLEHIRKPLSQLIVSLRNTQQNLALLERLDVLVRENEMNRQRMKLDKALISVLSSVTDTTTSIICTDPRGLITYFSPGAQNLLGYKASELVGVHTPMKLHSALEVDSRAKQLEQELGKKMAVGFSVFIENAQRLGSETRKWTYYKKDGTVVNVRLTVKPIMDDNNKLLGFVGIAAEDL